MNEAQILRLTALHRAGKQLTWRDDGAFKPIIGIGQAKEVWETEDALEPAAFLYGGGYIALHNVDPTDIFITDLKCFTDEEIPI